MIVKVNRYKNSVLRSNCSVNRSIIALVMCLYIFLPSIDFLPFRYPTVTGKFMVFILATLIIVFLSLVRLLVFENSFTVGPIDISFLLLVGYITLNRYGFQTICGFSIRFYELLGLLALFFIIKSFKNKAHYYWLLIAAVLGADIQIIIGSLQLYGFIEPNSSILRVTGGFFNSGPYSGYLVVIIAIGLQLLKKDELFGNVKKSNNKKLVNIRRSVIRFIIFFNIIGCATIIPALRSRAAYITVFFVIAYVYRKKIRYLFKNTIRKRVVRYLLVLGIMGCMITLPIFMYNFKKGSSEGRVLILKITTEMFKDRPLLGFGYDRFRSNYMLYQSAYFERNIDKKGALRAGNTAYAFNGPLQFSVENGIFGLVILLLTVYVLTGRRGIARRNSQLSEIAKVGILSIFLFSLFSYPSEILPIKLLLVLFVSILSADLAATYRNNFKIKTNLGSKAKGFIMVCLLFCCFMFYKTLKLGKAYYVWHNSHKNYLDRDYNLALEGYTSVYPLFESDGKFLTDYGLVLYLTDNPSGAISMLIKAKDYINNSTIENTLGDCYFEIKDYKNAEISYRRAIRMVPGSFSSHYLLLKMYADSHQTAKAVSIAKTILKLTIKVPSEATQGIINEAQNFLKKEGIN